MSRWILVLLVAAAAGFSTAGHAARAGSLADALASLLSPEPQKPPARAAEQHVEHSIKPQARVRRPREGKPPVIAGTEHEPTVRDTRPSAPPVAPTTTAPSIAPNAVGAVLIGKETATLKPHSVQTFSVLAPAVPPISAEGKDAGRLAFDRGHELAAAEAAVHPVEEPTEKPAIAAAPDPARMLVMLTSHGIIECGLVLLFVICILVSMKSSLGAPLPKLIRPAWGGLPSPPRINHVSRIGALIGGAEATAENRRDMPRAYRPMRAHLLGT